MPEHRHECLLCSEVIPTYRALCAGCFRIVPWELRAEVLRAYRLRVQQPIVLTENLIRLYQWWNEYRLENPR